MVLLGGFRVLFLKGLMNLKGVILVLFFEEVEVLRF